jgi:hypothetical protein
MRLDSTRHFIIVFLVCLFVSPLRAQSEPGVSVYLEHVSFGTQVSEGDQAAEPTLTMGEILKEKAGLRIKTKVAAQATGVDTSLTAGSGDLESALSDARSARASLLMRSVWAGTASRQVLRMSLIDVKSERTINAQTFHVPTEGATDAFFQNAALSVFGLGEAPALTDDVGMVPPSRVFVMDAQFSEDLLDDAGKATVMTRIGEVGSTLGQDVVTKDDLANLLANEQLLFALGEGDPDAIAKVASMANADLVLTTAVGRVGSKLSIASTLIDSKEIKVVNRTDITIDSEDQILEGVDSVIRGLFGFQAPLPTPRADPARFEVAMAELGQQISAAFAQGDGSGLGRVAILPLAQTGEAAAAHEIGSQTATFLRSLLASKHKIDVVEEGKTKSVTDKFDLATLSTSNTEKLQEIGIHLGAQVVVLGSVGDVGKDFLVQLRAVKVIGGKTIWSGYAVFPMGDPGSLIPAEALVVRTFAGAMYASVIPGGGQFYNGLSHYWKGGLILVGTVLSVGAAAVLASIAGYQYSQKLEIGKQSDAWFDACPTGSREEKEACGDALQQEYEQQAIIFGASALAPLAFGGLLHALGFVDAAIFVTDYSEMTAE